MTKDEIIKIVKEEIINVLPLIKDNDIKVDAKLSDLGANSIDRADITINCMRRLEVKINPVDLIKLKNIDDLVNALLQEVNSK